MDVVVSIGMGIIIVWLSLHLIKKEVKKASFFKHVQKQSENLTVNEDVISQVQRLERIVDEMNQSFYDIVNDLEGHYSQHEKEIDNLNSKLSEMSNGVDDLSRSIYYQSKELQTYSKNKQVSDSIDVVESGPVASGRKKDDENNAYKEVNRLKALGYDEQQIAKRMNKGIREIRMLLSFKK